MEQSRWRRARTLWGAGLVSLGVWGCGGTTDVPAQQEVQGEHAEVLTFEQFRARAYWEPDSGIYIVEGDTPLENEAQLREFYEAYRRSQAGSDVGTLRAPLIVNRVNGADDRWNDIRQHNITYCVSTTFGSNYDRVVQAMRDAAGAWQQVSVVFQHRGDQDSNCTDSNGNVVFDVRPVSGQPYLARAFFPSYSRANRNILIDSTSFGNTSPWTLTGILRHELGHTLGFRHEHTRPEARTCFEDNNWRSLSGYDAASVMHYPRCNGTNRDDLVLTSTDVNGAQVLYGPLANREVDIVFYLNKHNDLQAVYGSDYNAARTHWQQAGIAEGRRGSTHFDAVYYLAIHPDLRWVYGATNYPAALNHWLQYGINEGRRGSREFDVKYYLAIHPDLQAAFGNNYAAALDHWIHTGIYEGLRGSEDFDVKYYLAIHPDLQWVYGTTNYPAALAHWIFYGRAEGRDGAP